MMFLVYDGVVTVIMNGDILDIFVSNQNIVLRKIHSLYYLVDIKCNYNSEGHAIPALNEVGKAIWESLAEPTKIDAVVKKIIELFDVSSVSESEIKSDVVNYISMLIKMGYVTNVR